MSAPGGPPPLPSNPDENAGPQILGATYATTCFAFVTVVARFYVRTFMVKALGYDDFFMALAMATVSGHTCLNIVTLLIPTSVHNHSDIHWTLRETWSRPTVSTNESFRNGAS